jgi:hypothetical protein
VFGRFWAAAVHIRRKEFEDLLSPAFPVACAANGATVVERSGDRAGCIHRLSTRHNLWIVSVRQPNCW